MIKDIRRDNLQFLIETVGRGSQSAAASKLNLAPSFISQILSGTRNMGEKLARKIENEINLPLYAMDKPMTKLPEIEQPGAVLKVDAKKLEDVIVGSLVALNSFGLNGSEREIGRFVAQMVVYYLETGEVLNFRQIAQLEALKQEPAPKVSSDR